MSARTFPTKCNCGVVFDREVKRGRPQVWCPTCLAIPFYERNHTHTATINGVSQPIEFDSDGVQIGHVERVVNVWDQHDAIRHLIDLNVQAVYDTWPPVREAMLAAGSSQFDIANAQADALRAAYKDAGVR